MSCQSEYSSCVSSCGGGAVCLRRCDREFESCLSSQPSNFNVVQSIQGANISLNEEVLASEVWQPMFFWYWQLLNTAITFFPIIFVVSMFRFIYGVLKNLWKNRGLESSKSLDNK